MLLNYEFFEVNYLLALLNLCLLHVDQLAKYFEYSGFYFQLTSFSSVDKFFLSKEATYSKTISYFFLLVVYGCNISTLFNILQQKQALFCTVYCTRRAVSVPLTLSLLNLLKGKV
jgi:hypothetical protein